MISQSSCHSWHLNCSKGFSSYKLSEPYDIPAFQTGELKSFKLNNFIFQELCLLIQCEWHQAVRTYVWHGCVKKVDCCFTLLSTKWGSWSSCVAFNALERHHHFSWYPQTRFADDIEEPPMILTYLPNKLEVFIFFFMYASFLPTINSIISSRNDS